MSDGCVFHEKLEQRVSDVEDEISELKTKQLLDNQKFTMILENLSKLPDAINNMEKTLIGMQEEIKRSGDKTESLEKKFDKLNAKVCEIDEDGKFDIRKWIRQNFIALVLAVTGVGAWISTLIK